MPPLALAKGKPPPPAFRTPLCPARPPTVLYGRGCGGGVGPCFRPRRVCLLFRSEVPASLGILHDRAQDVARYDRFRWLPFHLLEQRWVPVLVRKNQTRNRPEED